MKKVNVLSFLLLMAGMALQLSCTNSAASINGTGLTIKGQIKNAENLSFYFDRINFDNSNHMYPKVEIDGSGNFEMGFQDGLDAGIYRARIGAKKTFLILDSTERVITINGDLNTFDRYDYELTGADASKEFTQQMKGFFNQSIDQNALEAYVKREPNALAAAFVTMTVFANNINKLDLLKEVNAKLKSQYPNSKYAADFTGIIKGQEARIAQQMASERIKVGNPAPEIRLEDPEGKEYALSDLKGKVVLLDFWASWCGPCRKANPHVVETYKKYKDKGFTVFSVSLDGINPRLKNRFKTQEQVDQQMNAAKKRWVDAIAKDQLEWDYHVSDLQHWNSIAAKTYGVRSIPQTFLIDRDGKIAVLNPRFNLEEELNKIL